MPANLKRKAVESLANVPITSQLAKWEAAAKPSTEWKKQRNKGDTLVGTGRFELPTPRTPSECSTRLSHVPTRKEPRCFASAADGVSLENFTTSGAVAPGRTVFGVEKPSPSLAFGFLGGGSECRPVLHFFQDRELDFLFQGIDALDQHTNPLSHAVCLARALADDLACILVV